MALSASTLAVIITNKLINFNTNKYDDYSITADARSTLISNQTKLLQCLFTAMLLGRWTYNPTATVSVMGDPILSDAQLDSKPTLITKASVLASATLHFPNSPDVTALTKMLNPVIDYVNTYCEYKIPIFALNPPVTSASQSGYSYSGTNIAIITIPVTAPDNYLDNTTLAKEMTKSMYSGTDADAKANIDDFTTIFAEEFIKYIKTNWIIQIPINASYPFKGAVAPSGTAFITGSITASSS